MTAGSGETARPVLFGANIDPARANLQDAFARARIAEEAGLDLIMCQDHPYNKTHLDTWTLITTLAAMTENVHIGTNVANLPLRPPNMLAKMAASLDVISGGRVELGIGAGAMWPAIAAFGGPADLKPRAFSAFKEALAVIQGMWAASAADGAGHFTFEGEFYSLRGAKPGPAPAHPIRIWIGAGGPKMLHLTGQRADGILLSNSYTPLERLPGMMAAIDAGAAEAGRPPTAIRRGWNLMGTLLGDGVTAAPPEVGFAGPLDFWVEQLVRLNREFRQDTFIMWPIGQDEHGQLERFAHEVVPAVRRELGEETQ